MISWIVATHNLDILYRNLIVSMMPMADDEFVVVQDAPSIAAAYNEGQARAVHPIRCYVHHDVQVLDLPRLRGELLEHVVCDVGMVGVIGSRTVSWPWWDGLCLGSVVDGWRGVLGFGIGGPCAMLDGLLLATVQDVEWDESIPGWHGYDHDACSQMLARGLSNYCLSDGHQLVSHNTDSPADPIRTADGFDEALQRVKEKWGD